MRLLIIFLFVSNICQAQFMANGWKFRGAPSGSNGLAAINTFYAKMDDSGTPIVDSKNANNGTLVAGEGAATFSATGKLNTAISVGSGGTSWDFGDASVNRFTTQGSISLWVNLSGVSGGPLLLCKGNFNTDRNGYMLGLSGSQLFFELANASAVNQLTVTGTLAVSTWYHVVITWDGSIIKSYVNGSFVNSISQTVNATSTGIDLTMFAGFNGTTYNSFHLQGTLDEVGLFNAALSATQVTTLYNGGTPFAFASFN